jgi:hypothetical protein
MFAQEWELMHMHLVWGASYGWQVCTGQMSKALKATLMAMLQLMQSAMPSLLPHPLEIWEVILELIALNMQVLLEHVYCKSAQR